MNDQPKDAHSSRSTMKPWPVLSPSNPLGTIVDQVRVQRETAGPLEQLNQSLALKGRVFPPAYGPGYSQAHPYYAGELAASAGTAWERHDDPTL